MLGTRIFRIGGAAEQIGIHPETLRKYEKKGLIKPERDDTGERFFTDQEIEQIRRIYEARTGKVKQLRLRLRLNQT